MKCKTIAGSGTLDILEAMKGGSLPLFLALSDIRQRYRRSTLGPFWISISMGVMIGCIGLIFGGLFRSPMQDFLPFLSCGLIIWSLISTVLAEATTSFCSAEAIIKQLPIPLFTHILRMVARNLYIFCHNIVILPIVFLIVHKGINWNIIYFVPALLILIGNLLWMSLLIAVVCTRYRDLTQIVYSLLQIAFYVTPIIWMPSMLEGRAEKMLLGPNPFYHLIAIVREPLLGQAPEGINWIFSIVFFLCGFIVTCLFFNKYKQRIAYWL